MARDSGGTYTRVSNSFSDPVASTAIDPNDADSFFTEIETEVTDSLCRSGKGSMLANLSMGGFAITTATSVQFKGSSSGFTVLSPSAAASGTLTLPAATDTLVGKATTDILTNKTLDSAGTGNVLKVSGVTVSAGQYPGETTTGSATAGNVGEYISSQIARASNQAISSNTVTNVTSISLTAGDWDVSGNVAFSNATSATVVQGGIGTTSATISLDSAATFNMTGATWTGDFSMPMGPVRISVSGTTTVYLVGKVTYTGTTTVYGNIRGRRAR